MLRHVQRDNYLDKVRIKYSRHTDSVVNEWLCVILRAENRCRVVFFFTFLRREKTSQKGIEKWANKVLPAWENVKDCIESFWFFDFKSECSIRGMCIPQWANCRRTCNRFFLECSNKYATSTSSSHACSLNICASKRCLAYRTMSR